MQRVDARQVGPDSKSYHVVGFRTPDGEKGLYHVTKDICPELEDAIRSTAEFHGEKTVVLGLVGSQSALPNEETSA